mgnify:CR=1 FL=1
MPESVPLPSRRIIDPAAIRSVYPILGSLVIPRPIAWVSTRSVDGVDNLAPHSFFTVVSTSPPVVIVSSMGEKDTVRNARETGEFVVCGSPADQIDAINRTAVEFPAHLSEFDEIGLTREPSDVVAPPRVAESPCALECRTLRIDPIGNGLVIYGEVVSIAIDESVMDGNRVDPLRLDPIARLGGSEWSSLGDVVTRNRLSLEEFAEERETR